MGYYLSVTKYDKKTREAIRKENVKFTFDEDNFKWYRGIIKLDEEGERLGNNISNYSAFYSLFIEMNKVVLNTLAKKIKGLIPEGNGKWRFDGDNSDDESVELLTKHVSFLNYSGDSSGFTWTVEEIKDLKDLLVADGQWDKIKAMDNRKEWDSQSIADIFDEVIANEATLELF